MDYRQQLAKDVVGQMAQRFAANQAPNFRNPLIQQAIDKGLPQPTGGGMAQSPALQAAMQPEPGKRMTFREARALWIARKKRGR